MSFLQSKPRHIFKLKTAASLVVSISVLLMFVATVYAQQPGGRRGGREGGMGGGMGNAPPQRMERQEYRQTEPRQMQSPQPANARAASGTTIAQPRTGDENVVVTTSSPDRPQQEGGPGGFQPGQGPPRPDGEASPEAGGPGGRPEGPREIPRERRYATNPANPDIRREDFNREGEARLLKINFQKAPWRVVIEWFASEAGLSLELESAPPGSFSYTDASNESHTIDETFNLLNAYLIRQNFLMIRTNKLLMLVNLNDGIPVDLIRDVPLERLDEIGDYEVVRVLFNLTGTTPEIVQAEIEKLLGAQGRIDALSKSQQIYVTEFGNKLRTMREVIKGIDSPDVAGVLEIITLEHLAADTAVTQLKALLPLADNDTTLRVLIDPTGKSIWLSGRIDRVETAKRMLKTMDIPVDASGVYLKVYPIPSADPATALAIVQTLLAGRPDVRASRDPNTGAIIVQGRAEDHKKVEEAIEQLENAGYKLEVIQLTRLSTTAAKDAIDEFFKSTSSSSSSTTQRNPFQPMASTSSSSSNNLSAPIVTTNASFKQLIIKGTQSQIEQIKSLLTKMGETNIRTGGAVTVGNPSSLRPIPMSEKQAQIVLQMAQQMWTQMGHKDINITTPSQILKTSSEMRTQPIQFNHMQPLQQPRQPMGIPNRGTPGNTSPQTRQEQSPVTFDGMQLPGYLADTPRERIHVIDGLAGENRSQEQEVTPPRPARQAPAQSVTPSNMPPQNNGQPDYGADVSDATAPNTSSHQSLINSHLDLLFGPTETTPAPQRNSPTYVPAKSPLDNLSTEDRLRTQTHHPGHYIPAAYRQEQEPAAENEQSQTEEEFAEEEFAEESASETVERDSPPAETAETRDAAETSTNAAMLPDAAISESNEPIGIVPNPNAIFDAAPLEATDADQPRLPQPLQFHSQQRDRGHLSDGPAQQAPMAMPQNMGNRRGDSGEVSVTIGSSGIVMTGNPETLDDFEELIHMLNSESLFKSQVTEFYLIKNAKAETIKTMLTSLLGSSSSTSSTVDPLADMPSDPMDALITNMFGGSKIQATGPYNIYVDARSNILIINANRVDHLTIQELLPILDRLGRSDDVLIHAMPHLITLQYMKAEDAETAVRTIFAENLQGSGSNNQQGGNRQQGNRGGNQGGMPMMGGPGMMMGPGGMGGGGPQEFIQQMIAQRMRGNQQQDQQITQTEVQTMTLAVETTTNSLIVYSPEELYLQVEAFVKKLDQISQNQEPTTTVVPYSQNSAEFLSNRIKAMVGDSVTVTNNATSTTNSTNRNQQGNRGGFGGGMPGMMPGGMMGGNRGGMPGGMMGGFGGGMMGRR